MTTPALPSRLPDVGTTIFAVMSHKAQQHGALNLSQGFPDFECPAELRERVARAMAAGHNQYAPMPGLPALTEAIANKVDALYGAGVDAGGEVTITSGATEALFVAIQAAVQPGDEVIVFDPAYDSYDPAVRLAGGRCIHLPLTAPDYGIDFDRLTDALTARTRMIVINSPHNPTGAVLSRDALDRLAGCLRGTDVLVLSDEVYEHIVFDGRRHESVLAHPELRERSFAVFSFGKTYHTTGWKIGYCVAPPALTVEFRKVHQFTTFSVSTPMQHAIAGFMTTSGFHLELSAFYQARRDRFRAALDGSDWRLLPCPGTYFQLLDYAAISDRPDTEMADWLTEQAGVASIPISVFHADGRDDRVLRFCFAKTDDTLDDAARRLRDVSHIAA